MGNHLRRLRAFFVHAAGYSLVSNLLLIVPSLFILQVFDRVLSSRSNETLFMLALLAVGAIVVNAMFDVLRGKLLTRAAVALDAELSPRLLGDLLATSARPHDVSNPHALRDVGAVRGFLTGPAMVAIFDLPWLPVYLLLIFAFHPLLGALALSGSLVLLFLAWVSERQTRVPAQSLQAESRRAHQLVDQSLRNAEVVSALGMAGNMAAAYGRQSHHVLGWQLMASDRSGLLTALSRLTRHLLQVLMMAACAWLVINLHSSAGVMIAGTLLLGRALAPIDGVISAWRSLMEARAAYGRLDEQLRTLDQAPARTALPPPRGALEAERLMFAVPGRDTPVIQGVSFRLDAGECLGIVGVSASGKSSLARLLMGVWQPQAGQVRLDGASLDQWNRERLGEHVGYLPQDVALFAGTVAQNIARMGAVDDERVVDAARRAGVHELILRLPQGYDTVIGQSGGFLSGGQRQRIALARALYGSPCLVVLDEPNANLDGEGEAALMQAIRSLKAAGTTVVMVAHRPSLLGDMDRVLVLREGRVELFGPRDEVMAKIAAPIARVPVHKRMVTGERHSEATPQRDASHRERSAATPGRSA